MTSRAWPALSCAPSPTPCVLPVVIHSSLLSPSLAPLTPATEQKWFTNPLPQSARAQQQSKQRTGRGPTAANINTPSSRISPATLHTPFHSTLPHGPRSQHIYHRIHSLFRPSSNPPRQKHRCVYRPLRVHFPSHHIVLEFQGHGSVGGGHRVCVESVASEGTFRDAHAADLGGGVPHLFYQSLLRVDGKKGRKEERKKDLEEKKGEYI
jgi:hypothetical protein